ncbi:MAG: ABC transporter ATP-binding protein [Candidatus Zixiibacteriota bacterium]|nr:MAG: ABC transporter ATP-binding protein [candidate division Zixibacteria bacterium]
MKLTTENLKKLYPNGAIGVDDLNMFVEEGRFAVLLGPSGCGKSTLLRLISGLERPTEGKIFIDGADITGWEPKKRDVAMVFQNYALYPHMTVVENLEFGLKSRKIPKAERKQFIKWAADLLELKELLDRKPRELSGGQRQRVALGRAIVRKPKLYLFDEPLSNLDAELRMKMRGEILTLHRRVKGTSIYVTHDQVEAMSLADIIYIMKEGRIISTGSPRDLFERPPDLFTAGFLGFPAMNLLKGELSGNNFISEHGTRVRLERSPQPAKPQNITLGIRPDDVEIVDSGDIGGKIVSLENLGRSVLLFVELEKGEKIRVQGEGNYSIGDNISISFSADRVFLYDNTGTLVS